MALALALSTKAKIAAATLTAATIIGGAFSVSAQQMALGGPDMTACDKLSLTAPARAVQCRVDAIKTESVALRLRTQVAQNDGDCAREISELRTSNPAATTIARELVKASGRPAAEYGICRLRDGIRAALAPK